MDKPHELNRTRTDRLAYVLAIAAIWAAALYGLTLQTTGDETTPPTLAQAEPTGAADR